MLRFRLDHSGVPTYLQLVEQVRQGVRLGILQPGDQLPTVKEVVAMLAINPNTVLKAYRELDLEGIVEGRRGVGTFISERAVQARPPDIQVLGTELLAWLDSARRAGRDDRQIAELFADTVHSRTRVQVA